MTHCFAPRRPSPMLLAALLIGCSAPPHGPSTVTSAVTSAGPSAVTPAGLSPGPEREPEPAAAAGEQGGGLPEGAAAMIDGELAVTMEEYERYLVTLYGRGPLRELLHQRLLERELAARGLRVDPAVLAERIESEWSRYRDARHGGDLESMQRELERAGYTIESYRTTVALQAQVGAAEELLVLATREVTPEQLRSRFDERFGVDGIKVEVRHLYLNRARVESELKRANPAPAVVDDERVQTELVERATGLLERARTGADFEALVRANSHDLSAQQNGGVIPGYNYRRYGSELADAVRAAEVGQPAGPVVTRTGAHLFVVESRVTTDFEAVREQLEVELREAPVTPIERAELRTRLAAAAEILTF